MTSNGNVREQITVALLGSTGSIGTQTIDVVASEAERFRITALAAGSDVIALAKQAAEIRPDVVVVADASRARELSDLVPAGIAVEAGADAMAAVAASADVAVNAVVGFAGLPVTMATLAAGKRLALANKESLIAAGPVVRTVRDIPGACPRIVGEACWRRSSAGSGPAIPEVLPGCLPGHAADVQPNMSSYIRLAH